MVAQPAEEEALYRVLVALQALLGLTRTRTRTRTRTPSPSPNPNPHPNPVPHQALLGVGPSMVEMAREMDLAVTLKGLPLPPAAAQKVTDCHAKLLGTLGGA